MPGLNVVASLGMMAIDVAKGDYTALTMDSLGILLPGAAVGLKIGYDVARDAVHGLRVGNEVRNVTKANTELVRLNDSSKAFRSNVRISDKVVSNPKYAESSFTKNSYHTDFYVKPNGDAIPATGYRYMSTSDFKKMNGSMDGFATYVGFEKIDSSTKAKDAFQIADEWSDVKYRGSFNTLQVIDDLKVPKTLGNTGADLEPVTSAYPQYGKGGYAQLIAYKPVIMDEVTELQP